MHAGSHSAAGIETALDPSTLPVLHAFRVLRPLGRGGMGRVFEAEDRRSGARTAIKMLSSLTPDAIGRFKAEFRALRDLHHPNLVRLGELFEVDGRWFFTMELVDGVDFLDFVRPPALASAAFDEGDTVSGRDTVRNGAPMPGLFDEQRLRSALGQLAEGLIALHRAGKLHRDVKPSNIRVDRGGRVVLLDFGLVTEIAPSRSSSEHGVVGTALYMAPEQGAAQPLGPAADWYAVGVTLYEALTGALPLDGPFLEVLIQKQRRDPLPPRALAGNVPADLDDLCVRLLARDPARRAGAEQVLCALGARTPAPPPAAAEHVTVGSVFVGRTRELGELRRAFQGAMRGEVTAVVVEGESGVGKSALIRRFCASLDETDPDVVVLSGRCYERESVPYKGFDSIMEAMARHLRHMDQVDAALCLPRDTGLLARLFPALHRVPAVRRAISTAAAAPSGPDLRVRAFSAVRSLLERTGERSPLVIWIDDFQWADADSLALLAELLQGADVPRMLLLLTLRNGSGHDVRTSDALLDLDKAHRVCRMQLGGLDPIESSELAEALCRQYAAGDVAAAIERILREKKSGVVLAR